MPTSRAAGHSRHRLEIDPLRDRVRQDRADGGDVTGGSSRPCPLASRRTRAPATEVMLLTLVVMLSRLGDQVALSAPVVP
jgi:hypothetical protein